MPTFQVTFVGPPDLAIRVATTLADADGVDLISSDPPAALGDGLVELRMTASGDTTDVSDAVATIRDGLPELATIDVAG